jgi:hypothetical protein
MRGNGTSKPSIFAGRNELLGARITASGSGVNAKDGGGAA